MPRKKLHPMTNMAAILIGVLLGVSLYIFASEYGFKDSLLPTYSLGLASASYLLIINIALYIQNRESPSQVCSRKMSWLQWNFSGYVKYQKPYGTALLMAIAAAEVFASVFFVILSICAILERNVRGEFGSALGFFVCATAASFCIRNLASRRRQGRSGRG